MSGQIDDLHAVLDLFNHSFALLLSVLAKAVYVHDKAKLCLHARRGSIARLAVMSISC